MANDFSEDSCKALWRFETGALTADSKGNNTLTAVNTPTADGSLFKEGAHSTALAAASHQFYKIIQANLDSGFPCKYGESNKKITICLWIRPTNLSSVSGLIGTPQSDIYNAIGFYLNGITLYYQYNTNQVSTGKTLDINNWWHLALVVDGDSKTIHARVCKEGQSPSDYSGNNSNTLTLRDAEWRIGALPGYDTAYTFPGNIDEVVVFDRLLSDAEIDKIRAGTYSYVPAGTFIYSGTIPVTATPSCDHNIEFTKTGTIPVTVTPSAEYYLTGPTEFVYFGNINVTVTPQAVVTREWSYVGSVPCTVTPSCEVEIPVHFYNGLVGVEVIPCATYMVPILGWDKYTGYGMVDVAFLSGDPPFWGVEGNIVLTINPAAASIGGAGEDNIICSGGVEVGGQSVVAFFTPPVLEIITSGGAEVGGRSVITWIVPSVPTIDAHVLSGGVQVGGQSVVGVTYPIAPPVLAVVTSGGVVVGGASVVNHALPSVLSIICSGGVQVGGFRIPELTVVQFGYPADPAGLTLAAVVGSGGVEVGGASVIAWSKPLAFAVPLPQDVADADVFVGGASIIAFIHPQILNVIVEGGAIIGGEPLGYDIFATYVLTGARGEPSVYSGWNFNSYATRRGQSYGAGMDGIYLLAGEDDAGDGIHSGVRIGPANFGSDREKRLRLLRCGGKTIGAQAKVSNGNGSAGYYEVVGGRTAVSREVQGREITIEIADFETLDHLEIVPLVLSKR